MVCPVQTQRRLSLPRHRRPTVTMTDYVAAASRPGGGARRRYFLRNIIVVACIYDGPGDYRCYGAIRRSIPWTSLTKLQLIGRRNPMTLSAIHIIYNDILFWWRHFLFIKNWYKVKWSQIRLQLLCRGGGGQLR